MEFQVIIFLIFGVIALIRALSRNNQEQQANQRANAGQPDRRRRVQSDIDAFLSEVSQASGNKPQRQRPAAPPAGRSRPQQQQRPQQTRQRQKPRGQQSRRQQAPRPTQERSQSKRALGSGVSEHVETYISQHVAEHVDSKVDDYVEVDIVESVDSNLGDRAAEMPVTAESVPGQMTSAAEFRRLLRSSQGVRQAILLNEVLKRPKSLRR